MQKIKNIIFDLGGIFIEIDFSKTEKAFAELGVLNFKDFFTQHTASPLFEDLETGACSPDQFYEAFRKESGVELTNEEIKNAWNELLGTFPVERLQWLEEIKNRYNIYLYSNTNIIHYEKFQEIFRENTGKENFDDYFIKAYYSHEIGLRKPYPESFTKLLKVIGIDPGETLFIDDTPKNVDGAKEAGLHAILLAPPKTVFDLDL